MTSRKQSTKAGHSANGGKSPASQLTRMEFYRVLDCLPERFRPYFITLAVTGLRVADLCDLQPESLNHDARAIRLKAAKGQRDGRSIHVAEVFWPYIRASIPVPVTHRYLRDHWNAAVDRAGLGRVNITAPARLRASLLAEARVDFHVVLLVTDGSQDPDEALQDQRSQEEADVLAQLFPVLALSEDERRRLVVRRVRD